MLQIDNKFYLDDKDLTNITLKEMGTTKDKVTGEEKPFEIVHGYFGQYGQALSRYVTVRVQKKQPESLAECLAELRAIHQTIAQVQREVKNGESTPRLIEMED